VLAPIVPATNSFPNPSFADAAAPWLPTLQTSVTMPVEKGCWKWSRAATRKRAVPRPPFSSATWLKRKLPLKSVAADGRFKAFLSKMNLPNGGLQGTIASQSAIDGQCDGA
jgi:hypothetical protein